MDMRRAKAVLLAASLFVSGVYAYVWPSPYDFLEDAYTVSARFGGGGIVPGVDPCGVSPFGFLPGRQAASEWLRLAYHDMATYNIETGLGGLDASIGFETTRAQNIGTAMNTSLVFFGAFQSKTSSMSDVMALGVILAMKNCGGPSIPFRAGRIDAVTGGPETVPEPQQDLEMHTAAFALQGFNVTEMIGLVACGHTIGGVHQVDFPLSVQNATSAQNPEGVVHFDDSFDSFDNHIATQWIDGTSTDPLAVGFNDTTNSDARIFAADGNTTMRAFAWDPEFFSSQCGSLLERMLNTVPNTVQLSEVIDPLPVKPYQLQLSLATNGSLIMSGYIRIFGTSAEAAAASETDMPVTLSWKDRNGQSNTTYSTSALAVSQPSTSLWGNVRFFQVDAIIESQSGISSFVVDWAFNSQDTLTHSDNGGGGFPLQDVALFQADNSCVTPASQANPTTTVFAVIRTDLGPITSAYIDYSSNVNQEGSVTVKQVAARFPLVHFGNSSSPLYDTYSVSFPTGETTNQGVITFDVVAVITGKTYASANNLAITTPC
ncbi:heme peroxidase [Mycena albidolilacea]|uniref:Peroxidase n=1 Tax=Mycena albidolilacea TaxID=1033008 RepID=A0AAD6Z022_9AGAR|nr:heme peroxidase [Mycena albidolilacea]